MTDEEFDDALVDAAFELGAEQGWHKVTAAAAAQRAGLELPAVRLRLPSRDAILIRFGAMADAHALQGVPATGSPRDRFFDILLRRFDFLHRHRAGVVALLQAATRDPTLGIWLARETLRSMTWMLEGAGIGAGGLRGALRAQGALAVWAWGLRAWLRDETADLSATMAAVDKALERADQLVSRYDPMVTAEMAVAVSDGPELPFAAEPGAAQM